MTTPLPAVALALGLVVSACSADSATVAMVPSSLTALTDEVDAALETDTDWIIAGSSRLVRQLADGASADLLITADAETMDEAIAQGIVETEPVVIGGNRLVLAVAPGNPGAVESVGDLADTRLLIGVCADEVPCGRLASAAATTLGLTVAADTEEPNVRSLATKIAAGELDAGLVYATDAQDLRLATVDDATLQPFVTSYLAASLGDGATEIISFLTSEAGRNLLAAEGFTPP